MSEFYMIFARKINKIRKFYTNYIKIARKKFSTNFMGGATCPLTPMTVSKA